MMPNRTRIAIILLAVIAALACFVPLAVGAIRSAHRPPVVITLAPGADNPPLPYASGAPPSDEDGKSGDASTLPTAAASLPAIAAGTGSSAAAALVYVHVAGAVRHPGVYQLPTGDRVFAAVHAAGGALPSGDTDGVNLAEKLDDGEKIFVPLKGQSGQSAEDEGDGSAAEANADAAVDPASLKGARLKLAPHTKSSGTSRKKAAAKQRRGSGAGGGKPGKLTQGQTIDINTADAAQLERLPGVGPVMAARILRARHVVGGFRSVNDLTYVPGLGPIRYKELAPFVRL